MTIEVSNPFENYIRDSDEWKPTPKQAQFIELPFDIDEALYGGAAGGGKSELLILLPLIYGFHEHPRYKGIILRRTFPELESEIIQRSRLFYPSTGAVYNESKHRWVYPNGGMDVFGHAKREEDIRNYDSAEYNLIRFDEATSFLEFQYLYLVLTRRRTTSPDLPAIARSATNPGNIGHIFFRERFVDPYPMGGRPIRDSRTNLRRFFLQCLGTENPHLLKKNPNYFSGMKDLGDAEYRAKALGDWYTFTGQVFREWRIAPQPGEPDNARHVIPYHEIPHWWPRIIAVDWGWKAWTFIIWMAIAPNGRVYIYRTYAEKGKYIKDWASDLINFTGSEFDQVQDIGICHSANQHRGEPHTILEQVIDALKEKNLDQTQVSLGKRDRIGGKMLVHEYLRWMPKPKLVKQINEQYNSELAAYILRNKGQLAYKQYIEFFAEEQDEANLPKLQIMEESPEGRKNSEIIDCIPLCRYQEKGEKDKSPEDVAEFDGDDPYDCLRIALERVDRYLETAVLENEKYKLQAKILANFEKSKDMHSYYLSMQKFESESNFPQPVRRYHR
jgi:hypothetical protein